MLWLTKDLFSREYENLPSIESQIETCQPSADWDLPVRVLLTECAPSCMASDSDNSESQAPLSFDRAQECIQKLRMFALHTGNGSYLDHAMDLQDMSATIRMNLSLE